VAEAWISTHAHAFADGTGITLAITLRAEGTFVGAVTLEISQEHSRASLGYWLGMAYWGQGLATEAARALVTYGFQTLRLHRIHAQHLTRNPQSGRIMVKLGMRHEGTLRQHRRKWGAFEDVDLYGMLAADLRAGDSGQG
jgi:ribosomal-protein-alanine N-acetyltransferase